MIAIAFLFVRMLCDCFKSRNGSWKPKSLSFGISSMSSGSVRHADCILRSADRALFIWLYRRSCRFRKLHPRE